MWSSIKSILKDNTAKCIIIEDGEPRYVVVPFMEYQQLQKQGNNGSIVKENNLEEEDINGEIQDIYDTGDEEDDVPVESVGIKIEDLPF